MGVHPQKEGRATRPEEWTTDRKNNEATLEIYTIFDRLAGGGSNKACRAHTGIMSSSEHYANLTSRALKEQKMVSYDLLFSKEDAHGVHHPHDDALVVTMMWPITECTESWWTQETLPTSSSPPPSIRWGLGGPDSNLSELLCSDLWREGHLWRKYTTSNDHRRRAEIISALIIHTCLSIMWLVVSSSRMGPWQMKATMQLE